MACCQQASCKHPLRGNECGLQLGHIDVGTLSCTHLAQNLRECGPSEACVAGAKIHEEENTFALRLKVGGNLDPHVWHRSISADDQLPRALRCLSPAARQRHTGCHRQGILAAINADAEVNHDVAQSLGCVVHLRPLTFQFRRPHPVARCLHRVEGGNLHPDQVCESLRDRKASHRSAAGRIPRQTLERLFAHGSGSACETHRALRDQCKIGQGRVQRAHALLLSNQPGNRTIHLVGQESLRAHRN
mmetsp:Transcript_119498/g.300405  ORF Transcript_119498/g.300405 Transcript_119498/m.300405 type:complete len:246 (-) Transcript_119498:454-1191(-)